MLEWCGAGRMLRARRRSIPALGRHIRKGFLMLKRTTVFAVLLLAALPALSKAQAPPQLRKAMHARLEAVWKKDAVTWARFTADEFTMVDPEGTLMNKGERLAALKAEKPEPVHALRREEIRAYGGTVLHRFIDGHEWVLEVWVRQNGVWRVVAAQVNIAKP